MNSERIYYLNDLEPDIDGQYVLYWMQQSQRAEFNHALEQAARLANQYDKGLVVGFGLMDDYPEANERHYAFMLEGLAETRQSLHKRGIKLVVRRGSPDQVALQLAQEAVLVVCDVGYLRLQRQWHETVAKEAKQQVLAVESDVVVPVTIASDKQEYAARTLRPSLEKLWPDFLQNLSTTTVKTKSLNLSLESDFDVSNPDKVLADMELDREVGRVKNFKGGTTQAQERLTHFLRSALAGYAENRSDPAQDGSSRLSPYLHFGQISPVEIACKVAKASSGSQEDRDAFLEELIVRRELAMNFVYFAADDYDSYQGLPEWARESLQKHRDDNRPQRYTRKQLENADTDDPYWNAAMQEMRFTGYMHNYMRMYWGKKIIEWCNTPEYAWETALYLNNRYFLDGRDPNSYTNIGWLFGLHDRGWKERDVFGKVRFMNKNGLERKFDMEEYVAKIKELSDD
jgi:deoxyribodipyrimidine photo-lyase